MYRLHKPTRRGLSVLEVLVACLLLAACMATLVKGVRAVADHRRQAEERLSALQIAENAMERLSAMSWDELTADELAFDNFASEAAAALRDGAVKLEVEPVEGMDDVRRVALEVHWRRRDGASARPVRLTTFAHRPANADGITEGDRP